MPVPNVTLANGVTIPQVGFGVFKVPDDKTEAVVRTALDAGYRAIDTAAMYGNERGVGRAVASSGLPRDDVFVTTKLWNTDQGRNAALKAFDASMANLGLDVLDLYLVHWPAPSNDRYVETWLAFEQLLRDGRVRAIGVSNFQPVHLRRLFDETGVRPVINQIELHPWLVQDELRAFHAEHGIVTEAWSPIGRGGELLDEPTITDIAQQHDRTAAQVVLRWHLQLGHVVIPKSATPERIRTNLELFDFQLTDDEMAAISGLNKDRRLGPDPATFAG